MAGLGPRLSGVAIRPVSPGRIWLRFCVVAAVVIFCHYGFWVNVQLFRVNAETLMLAATMSGVMLGTVGGPIAGFGFGLAHDLLAPTPLGLAALTFTAASYAMARLSETVELRFGWQSCAYGAAGMVLCLTLFASTGELIGQEFLITEHFPRVLWGNAVMAVPLSPGIWLALRRVLRPTSAASRVATSALTAGRSSKP